MVQSTWQTTLNECDTTKRARAVGNIAEQLLLRKWKANEQKQRKKKHKHIKINNLIWGHYFFFMLLRKNFNLLNIISVSETTMIRKWWGPLHSHNCWWFICIIFYCGGSFSAFRMFSNVLAKYSERKKCEMRMILMCAVHSHIHCTGTGKTHSHKNNSQKDAEENEWENGETERHGGKLLYHYFASVCAILLNSLCRVERRSRAHFTAAHAVLP